MYDAQLELTIGQILFHNQDLLDTNLVESDDFFTDMKDAVKRMISLRKNDNLLNETTVGRRLEAPSDEERGQFEELVCALKSLNKERRLQDLPAKLSRIVVDTVPYEDKLIKINQLVNTFEDNSVKIDDFKISTSLEEYKEKLFNKTKEDLLSTGIYMLDLKCGMGFKPGELVIVAGEPGGFKSTLIYNMALNVALRGEPVMLFTYEVNGDEIKEIMASMLAGVDSIMLRTRGYLPTDIPKLQKAFKIIEKLPLYVVDNNASMSDIRLMAYQKKPKIVLVDYLQIMPDIGENSVKSLEFLSRQFKLMANHSILNCPIVVISQFSRASTDKDGETVERKMGDLKGSSCLSYHTLITMANGTQIEIGKLYDSGINEANVITMDLDSNKLKIGKMINCFYSGERQLYNLKLGTGHEIKATAEHRFPTADGWKRLDELTLDDYIMVPRHINYFNDDIKLNNDLIEFVGYMIGDGCYLKYNTMKFTNSKLELISRVRKIANRYFDINSKYKLIRTWYDLYLTNGGNNPIIVKFKELGIFDQRSENKEIPDIFFNMSKSQIKLFIKSIWKTDGTYGMLKGDRRYISYSSTSIKLIRGLQFLLQKIGVISHIRKSISHGKFISYTLDITNDFQNDMIDILEINMEKTEKTRNLIDIIPSKFLRQFTKRFKAQNIGRLRAIKLDVQPVINNDIFWANVKSITKLQVEKTYDITVDDTHNFIANGIVTKNSIEQNAAIVMFTKHLYKKTRTGGQDLLDIKIVKNRHGIVGGITIPITPKFHKLDCDFREDKYKNNE